MFANIQRTYASLGGMMRSLRSQLPATGIVCNSVTFLTALILLPSSPTRAASIYVQSRPLIFSDALSVQITKASASVKIDQASNQKESSLLSKLKERLLQHVVEGSQYSADQLEIQALKARVFGRCLGIFSPDQDCDHIAIQGWQAIVKSPHSTHVYHLNRNGTHINHNHIASQNNENINISFELSGAPIPALKQEIIFQSRVSRPSDSTVTTISLMADGKIMSFTTGAQIQSHPVMVTKLSKHQVEQLERLLIHFQNFEGLNYLSSEGLSDQDTTILQSQTTTTQYSNPEIERLPRSLQYIIHTWNQLSQPKP